MGSGIYDRRAADLMMEGALAGLGGYAVCPDACAATLVIGQTAGLDTQGRKTGDTISVEDAFKAVVGARRRQVGKEAGANFVVASGLYGGQKEDSVRVCFNWFRTRNEPSRRAFDRNIRNLAQEIADSLSQREVLVEWRAPGRLARTDRASPPDAPPPTDHERFCAWVRAHSARARTSPKDACYRRGSGKRKR